MGSGAELAQRSTAESVGGGLEEKGVPIVIVGSSSEKHSVLSGKASVVSKSRSLTSAKGSIASRGTPRRRICTSLNVNSYVLLTAYGVYTFFTGSCYWGWDGIQDMLYKSDGFTWRCEGFSGRDNQILIAGVWYPTCPNRKNAIGDMYTTAFACHFGFSAVAGILLDVIGPKFCAAIGLGLSCLGWLLLSFASQSREGAYYAAAAFIGASSDTAYLPLLSIANLFPKNESLILSILGSIRSCSFAIPVILAKIYTGNSSYTAATFPGFCYGYIGVCVGFAAVVCVLLIPLAPFKAYDKRAGQATVYDDGDTASRERRLSAYTGNAMAPVPTTAMDAVDLTNLEELRDAEPSRTPLSSDLDGPRRRSSAAAATEPAGAGIIEPHALPKTSYCVSLKSPEYFLIVPVFCCCLIRGEFFSKSNKEILVTSGGDNCYNLFSIFNILSFLPAPIFGKLCDSLGTLWVILILNIDGIFVYLFVMFDSYGCKVVAILLFFIYTSFVLSNLYCYVADAFPAEHFGRLTGLASLIGGLFTLSSMGFYRMSTGNAFVSLGAYRFAPACCIMIGFGITSFLLWLWMKALQRKKSRANLAKQNLVAIESVQNRQFHQAVSAGRFSEDDDIKFATAG